MLMESRTQGALNFLGFNADRTEEVGQITKCCCGSEGVIAKRKKYRHWYHFFIPLMWGYYTAMDEDPYYDRFECPKCKRVWRTPKSKYCSL